METWELWEHGKVLQEDSQILLSSNSFYLPLPPMFIRVARPGVRAT